MVIYTCLDFPTVCGPICTQKAPGLMNAVAEEFIGRPNLPFKFMIKLLRQIATYACVELWNSYSFVYEDGKGMKV